MKYRVLIVNRITGRQVMVPGTGDWGEGSLWAWTEGNFGCDCNRAILCEDDDITCGDMARYEIPYALLEDGTKIEVDSQRI